MQIPCNGLFQVITLISAVNPTFSSLKLSRFQPLRGMRCKYAKKERRKKQVRDNAAPDPKGIRRKRLHILLLEARYPLLRWKGREASKTKAAVR